MSLATSDSHPSFGMNRTRSLIVLCIGYAWPCVHPSINRMNKTGKIAAWLPFWRLDVSGNDGRISSLSLRFPPRRHRSLTANNNTTIGRRKLSKSPLLLSVVCRGCFFLFLLGRTTRQRAGLPKLTARKKKKRKREKDWQPHQDVHLFLDDNQLVRQEPSRPIFLGGRLKWGQHAPTHSHLDSIIPISVAASQKQPSSPLLSLDVSLLPRIQPVVSLMAASC